MQAPVIQVEGLVKEWPHPTRGTTRAVDGLCFTVDEGEVYGLLGPNGAGKTTTLSILCTLVRPDDGSARICGHDVRTAPLAVREHLAYVPAEAGLPERLTPREAVELFARVQGVPRPREVSRSLLERLGCASFSDVPCGSLSTGMKRRVVLARALVHDPRVLLLDEPTDGLDVPGRRDVIALIREQAAQGRAVVLSSHILAEVEQVANRIGVVARGRLQATGTIAEVLAQTGHDQLDEAFLALTA